jgi:glycosyltransferase involved in cell wall biosynthesis
VTDKHIRILGTRGVPAAHGGFETFAEHLALYLVSRGWRVTVYCQEDGSGPVFEDDWRGVRRVRMPVPAQGAAGTIVFDWRSTMHAAGESGLVLTLGYNTAVFCALYRLKGLKNVINMDGVEWRRQKWGAIAKTWFWLNDWAGCWLGNHLVADHPEIANHLSTRVARDKTTMIPYGSDRVEASDVSLIFPFGLESGKYAILIARAEPENSILDVVRAWSRKPRGCRLVILGKYEMGHAYQRAVSEAASSEVVFLGAIYDKALVQSLRFHARFYVHGHQVGGTNPSLVESLGTGNAVLAHDNVYNRWVVGQGGVFFMNEDECECGVERLLGDDALVQRLQLASRTRHAESFSWSRILDEYEMLLSRWL